MTEQVFKMQRPIVSNDPRAPCLVYNEKRDIQFTLPMDDDMAVLFNGALKIYVRARYDGNKFHVIRHVPDRSW
jgi:hypothetical protein